MTRPQKTLRRQLADLAFGLAPLVIIVLATKPALRQALRMRAALTVKRLATAQADAWQGQADLWRSIAAAAATAYQRARL